MEYVLNTEVSMVPERYILRGTRHRRHPCCKLAPCCHVPPLSPQGKAAEPHNVRSLALAALLPLPGLDQSGLDGLAGAEG